MPVARDVRCITRRIVDAHPGVFTVDGYHAVALNQDGTINSASNPAPAGTNVTIFATGLGPVEPAQPDGAVMGFPLPGDVLVPVLTSVAPGIPILPGMPASIPVEVRSAGAAPLQVVGVSQVTFVANGSGWPLSLTAGTGQCWAHLFQGQ